MLRKKADVHFEQCLRSAYGKAVASPLRLEVGTKLRLVYTVRCVGTFWSRVLWFSVYRRSRSSDQFVPFRRIGTKTPCNP